MGKGEKRTPDWKKTSARLIVKYGGLAYRDSGTFVEKEKGVGSELWRLRQCDTDPRVYEMRIPAMGHEYCDKRERIIIETLKQMEP
jgi:hypothetical protein